MWLVFFRLIYYICLIYKDINIKFIWKENLVVGLLKKKDLKEKIYE